VERLDDLIVGEDGLVRCAWGDSTPDYRAYHDAKAKWGRPVTDDNLVFETLCLEGFRPGLSWLTILRKRDGFRAAFAGFDPTVVAKFEDGDVDRLVGDARIVRHRGKIAAAVTNARATLALWEEGISLAGLVWQHRPADPGMPVRSTDVPPTSPQAKALSAELRRRGFAFVGPTPVYAAMQALGVVNDHLQGCHWRDITGRDRAGVAIPNLKRT
jgi:DNA-3-methyladenine glycosylase I